jgi:hypothetical protein
MRTTRRAVAGIAATVALLSLATPNASPAGGSAVCDDVLVPGPAWLGGLGVDIRSNGPYTTTGISCRKYITDLNGKVPQWGLGWQCVELVNRLYLSRGWTTSTWTGNGGEMYDTAPSSLAKEPQGSIRGLSLGDVVVLGSDPPSGVGHAAVVGAISGQDIKLFSQNTLPTPTWTATFSNGTLTVPRLIPAMQVTGVVHAPYHGAGYWMLSAGGEVYGFGDARNTGSPTPLGNSRRAVRLVPTPDAGGYWVVDDGGNISTYGNASDLGSVNIGALHTGETVTGLSTTPSGKGYWIFTSSGRVLQFGDAPFLGDIANRVLNAPVLDAVPTPGGNGYYMVAADGGIFAFGDAVFYGSMGGKKLNKPVQSLVPTASGGGYWLVASDGGIFAFGDARFLGSMGGKHLAKPVVGMVRFGSGYLMVASDGGIFNYSDRPFLGSLAVNPPDTPIVAVAPVPA